MSNRKYYRAVNKLEADSAPGTGKIYDVYRSKEYLLQDILYKESDGLEAGNYEYYEIEGEVVEDDGGPDGIKVRVRSATKIRRNDLL